jgi:hypothetical protein
MTTYNIHIDNDQVDALADYIITNTLIDSTIKATILKNLYQTIITPNLQSLNETLGIRIFFDSEEDLSKFCTWSKLKDWNIEEGDATLQIAHKEPIPYPRIKPT